MSNEIKTNIEIAGIILTDSAIETIKSLQIADNSGAEGLRNVIADAVCLISSNIHNLQVEYDTYRIARILSGLSNLRDEIETFKKP